MKLLILVAALAVQGGSAPTAQPGEREAQRPAATLPSPPQPDAMSNMPNVAVQPPGCRSIVQQVQDEALRNRDGESRTLDREPPASLLLAVDRRVGGCREPTFIRRNIR